MEGEFVPAAEAMPEEKYSFAPTTGEFKGVRTFSQQVKHVAAVNYIVAAGILGEKPPVDTGEENGPDSAKSKADIVKFLKDSFAYAHKAVATINDANSVESMKSPFGEGTTTRLSMAVLLTGHGFDHYGQMVEYLRLIWNHSPGQPLVTGQGNERIHLIFGRVLFHSPANFCRFKRPIPSTPVLFTISALRRTL
jgi:hypothetical protein